jgi:hypothetical protein
MARTDKDKMLAGELYDVSDPEIQVDWRQRIAGSRATTLHWTAGQELERPAVEPRMLAVAVDLMENPE